MTMLSREQLQLSKRYILQNSRLLERQLCEYFFGSGTKQACLRALLAYQNPDGGYGNGLEPDLLCQDSTAIGAETALFILELLEIHDTQILTPLVNWIVTNQAETGIIPHPPAGLFAYPHQPWWTNPDPDRVLALAGLLKKHGVDHPGFIRKVKQYALQVGTPEAGSYYTYPHFIYLKYCAESDRERAKLATMIEQLPILLEKFSDHFPLLNRAWFYAADYVDKASQGRAIQAFVAALQTDGGLKAPYPELPWWRPIWTLDGLILMRKMEWI